MTDPAVEQRPARRDPLDPRLSQARHHIPRHHHAARRCARLPPRGRRTGAALGRDEDRQGRRHRGARIYPRRRGGASGVGRLRADPQEGKLPHKRVSVAYALEYGIDEMEMHADALVAGERVVLVDDLIATGGTAEGAVKLLRQLAPMSGGLLRHDLPDLAAPPSCEARRAGAHAGLVRGALTFCRPGQGAKRRGAGPIRRSKIDWPRRTGPRLRGDNS